ncbi:MAG TPA: hypothetical protein PKK23_03275 [Nitrospirales bacterium]|nr:hypothetical protein [Nitrospirales bacterium]
MLTSVELEWFQQGARARHHPHHEEMVRKSNMAFVYLTVNLHPLYA